MGLVVLGSLGCNELPPSHLIASMEPASCDSLDGSKDEELNADDEDASVIGTTLLSVFGMGCSLEGLVPSARFGFLCAFIGGSALPLPLMSAKDEVTSETLPEARLVEPFPTDTELQKTIYHQLVQNSILKATRKIVTEGQSTYNHWESKMKP